MPNLSARGIACIEASPETLYVDLDCDYLELFFSVYKTLTLPELARWWRLAQKDETLRAERERIFQNYDYRWSLDLEKVLHSITSLPFELQEWVGQKGFGPRDLAPLRLCYGSPHFLFVAEILFDCFKLGASRSETQKILELAWDLSELKTPVSEIFSHNHKTSTEWMLYLQRLRNPLSAEYKSEILTELKKWRLPAHVRANAVEQQDRLVMEFHIQSHSPKQMEIQLQELLNNLKTTEGDSWKSHS